MRLQLYSLFNIIATAAICCSCALSEPEYFEEELLELSPTNIICTQGASIKSVELVGIIDLTGIDAWCDETWLDPSIDVTDSRVYVSIDENTDSESRSATVTVQYSEGAHGYIYVEQLGQDPAISIYQRGYTLEMGEQELTIEVVTNIEDLVITPSDSWITSSDVKAIENYTFSISANNTGETRTATIEFDSPDGEVSSNVTITQKASADPIEIERTGWSISVSSSQNDDGGGAEAMLDDNYSTYWHSSYSNPSSETHPHNIEVDMGSVENLAGLWFVDRQNGLNCFMDQYYVEVSTDGSTWQRVGEIYYTEAIAEKQYIPLSEVTEARMFRVTTISTHSGNSNQDVVAIAEIGAYSY